jgi:Flp pilus assembly protein TadG
MNNKHKIQSDVIKTKYTHSKQEALTIKRFFKNNKGSSAVEFALILPAFFSFIFGCIEFGMIMWGRLSLEYATSKAARYAYVNSSTTSSAVTTYASTLVPKNYASNLVFSFTATMIPKTSATVTGKFTYKYFFLPLPPLTMSTSVLQPLPTS